MVFMMFSQCNDIFETLHNNVYVNQSEAPAKRRLETSRVRKRESNIELGTGRVSQAGTEARSKINISIKVAI